MLRVKLGGGVWSDPLSQNFYPIYVSCSWHYKIPFTCRVCCRNEKVDHIYQYLYPGWQKLPQPSTGSSYVTSYIKSFILENKFPLRPKSGIFPTLFLSSPKIQYPMYDLSLKLKYYVWDLPWYLVPWFRQKVSWRAFVHGLMDNDKKVAFSKKLTQFKTRV